MTIEEYRGDLVKKLKKCGSEMAAHRLINQAAEDLLASKINPTNRAKFWRDLNNDLESQKPVWERILEKQAAAALSQVIAAAQAAMRDTHRAEEQAVKNDGF